MTNIETWHRTPKMKPIQSYEFHLTIEQCKIVHPLLAIPRAWQAASVLNVFDAVHIIKYLAFTLVSTQNQDFQSNRTIYPGRTKIKIFESTTKHYSSSSISKHSQYSHILKDPTTPICNRCRRFRWGTCISHNTSPRVPAEALNISVTRPRWSTAAGEKNASSAKGPRGWWRVSDWKNKKMMSRIVGHKN